MNEVDRDNFGLTLDFGHCLMAGENPAQSIALVCKKKRGHEDHNHGINKLFGVQLGDGYGRLGAEDGLLFGSIHPTAALEFVVWLIKTNYKGHIYFDTFPRNEDPVRECELNIKQFKKMYHQAKHLLERNREGIIGVSILESIWAKHDGLGVLELFNNAR
jgi:xylose isomerase